MAKTRREPACPDPDDVGRGKPAPGIPPRQHNFEDAATRALQDLAAQTDDQITWLGAVRRNDLWTIPVLDDMLSVDLTDGGVRTSAGVDVGRFWRVIVLHYLGVSTRPAQVEPSVGFADLPSGRTYAPVYRGRVIGRLCHTAGRDAATLREAVERLEGEPVDFGDLAFDFRVFPRVTLRLVWYSGDEELSPSASLLVPSNIETFFSIEDVVVLSEGLVARLGGRPF